MPRTKWTKYLAIVPTFLPQRSTSYQKVLPARRQEHLKMLDLSDRTKLAFSTLIAVYLLSAVMEI